MANHCYEVVCVGCGKFWCDRGCGWHGTLNEEDRLSMKDAVKNDKPEAAYCSICKSGNQVFHYRWGFKSIKPKKVSDATVSEPKEAVGVS